MFVASSPSPTTSTPSLHDALPIFTANNVPSYLGSSFAFIAPITASIEADSMGAALGGVMITGLLLAALGLLVARIGTSWITLLMPPVVMGSIVALIGFNLAQIGRAHV